MNSDTVQGIAIGTVPTGMYCYMTLDRTAHLPCPCLKTVSPEKVATPRIATIDTLLSGRLWLGLLWTNRSTAEPATTAFL